MIICISAETLRELDHLYLYVKHIFLVIFIGLTVASYSCCIQVKNQIIITIII